MKIALLLLLWAPAFASDLQMIEPPPPPGPVLDSPRKPFELAVPVLAKWEGKPLRGGDLRARSCSGQSPVSALQFRTDYKGRAVVKFLVRFDPKPGDGIDVCLSLYSRDGVLIADSSGRYVVGSDKPVIIEAKGALTGESLDLKPLDDSAEVKVLKGLASADPRERAIAASLVAERRAPPLSMIPALAKALEREYDAKAPASSAQTRFNLIAGLSRYHLYQAQRTRALRRAIEEDPDKRLRKKAASAPNLKP